MKTTKKVLALVLAVLTMFSCFALAASAVEGIYVPVEEYDTGELNVKNWARKQLYYMYPSVKGDWDSFKTQYNVGVYFSKNEYKFNSPEELRNAVAEGKVVYKTDAKGSDFYFHKNQDNNGEYYQAGGAYVLGLDLNEEGFYYLLLPEGFLYKGNIYNTDEQVIYSAESVLGSFEFNKKNTTFFWLIISSYLDLLARFYALFGFELM